MLRIKGAGEGTRTKEEICDEARRLFSVDLVLGATEFSEFSINGINRSHPPSRSFYIYQNSSDFIEWYTDLVPFSTDTKDVVFIFWMGTGIGALSQSTGQFDLYLNKKYILSFRVAKENLTWRRGDCSFHYWVKNLLVAPQGMALHLDEHVREEAMASYGLGFLKVPKTKLRKGRNVLKVCSKRKKIIGRPVLLSKRWFRVDLPPHYGHLFFNMDIDKGLKAVSGKDAPPEIGKYKIFFGDLHAHSGQPKGHACGSGTVDENYEYARDVANLDIFALAEHEWQMPKKGEWELRLEKADEFNEDGHFVTLPSFEWTNQRYGHRNVYYLDSKRPLFATTNFQDVDYTPDYLWRELRKCGAQAITVPHHPNISWFPLDWSYKDPEFDRLVEVYSNWGNSEYFGAPYSWPPDRLEGVSVQDALAQGHNLGIIASSDCHDGHPGNSERDDGIPGISEPPGRTIGSGRVAVLAQRLTREAVFHALYERRCYATTGTRILLDFNVNGKIMGSEITVPEKTSPRTISAKVEGTANIACVELVRNNVDILRKESKGRKTEINFVDQENIGNTCFYYLRVTQQDYEMAWSSPVWVTTLDG
jgi:hypothetical protein